MFPFECLYSNSDCWPPAEMPLMDFIAVIIGANKKELLNYSKKKKKKNERLHAIKNFEMTKILNSVVFNVEYHLKNWLFNVI